MLLKLEKKEKDHIEIENLSAQLRDSREKTDFYLLSIRTLLHFLKDFSLDLKEINSDKFKEEINRLLDVFSEETRLKRIRSRFEKNKKGVSAYINLHWDR